MSNVIRTVALDISTLRVEKTVSSYQQFLNQGAFWDGMDVRVPQQADEMATASHTATYMVIEEGDSIPDSFYSEEFPETNYEWFAGQPIVTDEAVLFLCYKTTL